MSHKNSVRFVAFSFALAVVIGMLPAQRAQALNVTWNVSGNGDWDTTSANWTVDASMYTEGDNVTFNSATVTPGIVTLTGDRAPGATNISNATGAYTFNGFSITSGDITKSNAGTATINSTYTGSGTIAVNGGTLNFNGPYSGAGSFSVAAATTLGIGGAVSINNPVTGSGTISVGGGGVLTSTASNQFADTIRITGVGPTSTWNMAGFDETISFGAAGSVNITNMGNLTVVHSFLSDRGGSGVLSGSGSLTFAPSHGTTIISGTHLYTGGTNINGGQASFYGGAANQLPVTGDVFIAGGASMSLSWHDGDGNVRTIDALSGSGTVFTSNVGNNDANTLRVGNGNGSGNWAGTYSGTGALIKLGTGTQTLSGSNTYTGTTTISAGRLTVNGSSGPNQGNYTVASGATLAGTGVIGLAGGNAVTLNSNATIEATNVDGLTINGGLTLSTGSILEIAVGGGLDTAVDVNGLVTGPAGSGGITLQLSDAGVVRGDLYTLLEWNSTSDLSLTDFTVVGPFNTYDLLIVGNALVFSVPVPEPSTCLLLGLGAVGLAWQGRRRRAARHTQQS